MTKPFDPPLKWDEVKPNEFVNAHDKSLECDGFFYDANNCIIEYYSKNSSRPLAMVMNCDGFVTMYREVGCDHAI